MHIYFINYHKYSGASGIHIHFLANAFISMGIPCTVCVPNNKKSINNFGEINYSAMTFFELYKKLICMPKSFKQEGAIFHAWTPRENVRLITAFAAQRTNSPYFIHLEDNEEFLYKTILSEKNLFKKLIKKTLFYLRLINPNKYKEFLMNSNGISCIVEKLEEFIPQSVPGITFYPACDEDFFTMPETTDLTLRERLGIPQDALVVTYTGNIHSVNYDEVKTLYDAINILNKNNMEIYLVHCGMGNIKYASCHIECGNIAPQFLYDYIRLADILVQPGSPNEFNDYRFPSKIPMYLASGRPVILPNTNIGKKLKNGENCLLLKEGSLQELVSNLEKLIINEDMRKKIGRNGRQFAVECFDWEKNAIKLLEFYVNNIKK